MKTGIFVDGSNIYSAAKLLGYEVDYARLISSFNADGSLICAYYYTATLPGPDGTDNLRPLLDYLSYNGWRVVSKPAKVFKDMNGRTKVKGNMDIEIAVDVMRLCSTIDNVILFSGDGDFKYLVEAVQQLGVRVTVVSTMGKREEENDASMIADELRRAADLFLDMNSDKIRGRISKHAKAEL